MDTETIQTPRHIEIRHVGDFDVVLNPANTESGQENLPSRIVDGLDSPPPNDKWLRHPINNLQPWRENIFMDDLEHPLYILKRRWITSHKGSFLIAVRDPKNYRRYQNYRYGSVLNEMTLSNEISKMVSHPEAQRMVRELGYKEISFIEPIMAAIERKTAYKYVLYRYVDAVPLISSTVPERNKELLESLLREYFTRNGIDPIDFDRRQMMIRESDKALFLIDIEGYTRTSGS